VSDKSGKIVSAVKRGERMPLCGALSSLCFIGCKIVSMLTVCVPCFVAIAYDYIHEDTCRHQKVSH
jgi:hypothetical protein